MDSDTITAKLKLTLSVIAPTVWPPVWKLDTSTILRDAAAVDTLYGKNGRNWFLASGEAKTPDRSASKETRTVI